MQKRRIIKIFAIIITVLLAKTIVFGLWHFESFREMVANVLLPIAIHIMGGLGTVFFAWWLVDRGLRADSKREEWEVVFAKAFSDLRRDLWLARELKGKASTLDSSQKVYARYWIEGLGDLRLKLPTEHTVLEHKLWSLIHLLDVSNKMLDEEAIAEASGQAVFLMEEIRDLEPHLRHLSKGFSDFEMKEPNFSEIFAVEERGEDLVKQICSSSVRA